jgi:hypothetical protein
MFGKNIEMSKMEMQHFLSHAFKYFYIAIWFCMKLEDVLKVLIMLMSLAKFPPWSHYYLKDLKRVYYACRRLPYGKEDQTLLTDTGRRQ